MAYQDPDYTLLLKEPSKSEGVHSHETGIVTSSQSLLEKLLSGLNQRRIPAEGCNYGQEGTLGSRARQ